MRKPEVLSYALLFSVFIIASCGLAYELIAGALSSYLLGDSVTQFSTIIGVYLFAMGVGSYLSRHIETGLVARFIQLELLVGVLGGSSAALLFLVFAYLAGPFKFALYGVVMVLGILVGLEIPLVMRILSQHLAFKELVSEVLTFDYLGALAISVLFPLVLAPKLGMVRTGFLFGLLNVGVALWTLVLFREEVFASGRLARRAGAALLVLLIGFLGAERLTGLAEENLYADDILFARTTPYQRLVVTRWKDDIRLFLNGNLQFSTRDEYRYHEALIHPALATLPEARRVLVLGGGDGLAVREILRYPQIDRITLVDLDPEITRTFARQSMLREINGDALNSPKLGIVNADALVWLEQHDERFDFIVADFPDPSNYGLGKLYTSAFYRLLDKHLERTGLAVVQATSPLYARQAFWCVVGTLEDAGFWTVPYHALVPSFGEWGFIIASHRPYRAPERYSQPLRFLTPSITATLFEFPADMQRVDTEINRLNSQVLVRYFEEEWRRFQQ